MNIELRLEEPADYRETENVTREAFWNQYQPGCIEHFLLHIMREDSTFVPALDFVAVHDGRIVGNAVCVESLIRGDDGKDYPVLGLGPISVLPEYQGKGVGGRLIAQTQQTARTLDYPAIVLYGDPAYYARYGFRSAEAYGIRTADDQYAAAHQLYPLSENALQGITGQYFEGKLFAELDTAAVEAFDQTFPEKQKLSGTPAQQRFEKIAAQRRPAL